MPKDLMPTDSILRVENLACARSESILCKHVCFELQAGYAMQVYGSNGCGKSTLLRTIAGLIQPYSGTVQYTQPILYAGHANNFHPALTPIQNLLFITKLQSIVSVAQVTKALHSVGLELYANVACELLSAGQIQRILLARLLLASQKIWLLDEPHINLDAHAQQQLHEICKHHLQQGGVILVAAHRELDFCSTTLQLEDYV